MSVRSERKGPRRQVLTDVMCRLRGDLAQNPSSVDGVVATVVGLSAQLQVGLALAFVPLNGPRPTFSATNDVWSLYGLVEDAIGNVVRLSDTRINGDADVPIPEGWEGTTTLHGIEVDADFTVHGSDLIGEWRLSVVLEPVDPGMDDECFNQLVGRVQLSVPQVAEIYAGT
jgi:hypothetical protein